MLFLIVLGAMILGYFFSVTRLPFELASMVSELPVNRYVILVLILLTLLVLGCLMDSMAIVLLTVPVFYPLILQLNFEPIWFGILVVRVTEMGLITPPVGLNVFVIQGITQVPMHTIFRGVYPFSYCRCRRDYSAYCSTTIHHVFAKSDGLTCYD